MTLPTFLVIGAAKGGTTSLHFYLRQHPEIFLSHVKETNFYWAEGRLVGRRIPASLAAYARFFEDGAHARAIGEISPQYLNSPTAARRIKADLPDVRLVVSLRSPAERAYSDYLGRVRIDRERRRLSEAVRPGERIFDDGLYAEKLARYTSLFPRDRLHVILYDDYARDPAGALRQLFAFLGVDQTVSIDTSRRHNPAEVPRSPLVNRLVWTAVPMAQRLIPARWQGSGRLEPLLRRTYRPADPMPADLRRRLRDQYRADVEATAALIGRDLSHWVS